MTGASEHSADEPPVNPKKQQQLEAVLARVDAEHAHQHNTPWHDPGSPLARPGEGPRGDLGTSVNWHAMEDDDFSDTFGALCTFLEWAIPRWNFTTEQFPYHCWWMHTDVFEEITAWWGLWQSYIRNPSAHIAESVTFHERTDVLKDRLANTYRGRCRHQHETAPALPAVSIPDLATLIAVIGQASAGG
ncbi:MAG: hypothetical protein Q8M17_07280 [Actinomycetota bacterium]|nr:hypothetical protein [Actinomycetota bacterium]